MVTVGTPTPCQMWRPEAFGCWRKNSATLTGEAITSCWCVQAAPREVCAWHQHESSSRNNRFGLARRTRLRTGFKTRWCRKHLLRIGNTVPYFLSRKSDHRQGQGGGKGACICCLTRSRAF